MNADLDARRLQLTPSPWHIVLALAASMALLMTGALMIMPLFAHRFADLGAGVQALGLSDAAAALGGIIAALLTGTLADRIGRRPVILVLAALDVVATAGFLVTGSVESYILLRGLCGACITGIIPAVMGIVADVTAPDRRAQSIGIVSGGSSIGWIVGPLFGGFLYDRWGYRLPFALAVVFAVVTLLFVILVIPETKSSPRLQSPERKPSAALARGNRSHAWSQLSILLAISFGTLFAWAFVQPQFMFYGYGAMRWTGSQLSLIISLYGVALMLGEFTLGRLSDHLGRKPVLVLGLAMFAAQFFGLASSDQYLWIAFSFVIAGLGNAIYDPALCALFLDLAPEAHKSRIMGFKTTLSSLGSMAGPALLVLVAPSLPSRAIFATSLLLVVAMTLATALALRAPARTGVLQRWQSDRNPGKVAA